MIVSAMQLSDHRSAIDDLRTQQHDAQLDYYGKRLATCSSDRTVKVFDVVDGDTQRSGGHTLKGLAIFRSHTRYYLMTPLQSHRARLASRLGTPEIRPHIGLVFI